MQKYNFTLLKALIPSYTIFKKFGFPRVFFGILEECIEIKGRATHEMEAHTSIAHSNVLTTQQRLALERIVHRPRGDHGVARRANAILLLDDGKSHAQIAEFFYLDDDTVRGWFKRFEAGGWEALERFDWHGGQSHSGCLKLLHRMGFEYRKPKALPRVADEGAQRDFIAFYEGLLNNLPADETVYFADAVHPEYQRRPAFGWVKKWTCRGLTPLL